MELYEMTVIIQCIKNVIEKFILYFVDLFMLFSTVDNKINLKIFTPKEKKFLRNFFSLYTIFYQGTWINSLDKL